MDVKVIRKINLQQKLVNIFHQVFRCLQYWHLKEKKYKHDIYRGTDCRKKFCESLTDHAMEIIKFKKKKMKLLTKGQQESNENARIIDICKVKF